MQSAATAGGRPNASRNTGPRGRVGDAVDLGCASLHRAEVAADRRPRRTRLREPARIDLVERGKSCESSRCTVDLTTSASVTPAARRICSRLSITTSVCSSIVSPFTFPVPASIGPQPVTKTKSPARMACEYAPSGGPAFLGADHLLRHRSLLSGSLAACFHTEDLLDAPPRTPISSSARSTAAEAWYGTKRSRSPIAAAAPSPSATMPCSSFSRMTAASTSSSVGERPPPDRAAGSPRTSWRPRRP